MAYARRQGAQLPLLMLDLDHFESVNDRFGHPTRVGVSGGEKFVVLLPYPSEATALLLSNKQRQKLADAPCAGLSEPESASHRFGLSAIRMRADARRPAPICGPSSLPSQARQTQSHRGGENSYSMLVSAAEQNGRQIDQRLTVANTRELLSKSHKTSNLYGAHGIITGFRRGG